MTAFSSLDGRSRPRVAIFIDGDHIPPSFRPTIEQAAQAKGNPVSTQVFCDVTARPDWAGELDMDIQHCKGRPGKNRADMALCIAALDLAYRGLATAFVIASNDRDFAPLVRHLDRMGCIAEQIRQTVPSTPALAFVQSPVVPAPKPDPKAAVAPTDADQTIIAAVRSAIAANGGPDGLRIAALNQHVRVTGFTISTTPQKTWRAWLSARPQHFACDPRGPDAAVRIVP